MAMSNQETRILSWVTGVVRSRTSSRHVTTSSVAMNELMTKNGQLQVADKNINQTDVCITIKYMYYMFGNHLNILIHILSLSLSLSF